MPQQISTAERNNPKELNSRGKNWYFSCENNSKNWKPKVSCKAILSCLLEDLKQKEETNGLVSLFNGISNFAGY